MNTKTMFEREDFFPVFYDTIKRYFKVVHNIEVSVSKKKTSKCTSFYLFYIPLFAASFPMNEYMREFLYSEYNIRGNLLKYVAGKIGVFLITHSFGIGAYSRFFIDNNSNLVRNIFISPCNRTIRFYNFKENYVDCIMKSGYKPDFLENQLIIRRIYNYKFIPKVLCSGENWYRECVMHGNALVRVRDEVEYERCRNDALHNINIIVKDTLKFKGCREYYCILKDEVNEILHRFNSLMSDRILKKMISFYDSCEDQIRETCLQIPLCLSHGDLQEGNIWVNRDGTVTIYDWEAAKMRSVWYDPATFFYNMHAGMEYEKLRTYMTDRKYLLNDPCQYYSDCEERIIASILILEDLAFNLSEAWQLSPKYGEKRLEEIISRFNSVLIR